MPPPGGLAGGDTLNMRWGVAPGAHGLVTTPGATRFYKTVGEPALQRTASTFAAHSRMEWHALETIAFSGCAAENRLILSPANGAEMICWVITTLILPTTNKPFDARVFCQHFELPGVWLERARIQASDQLLLDSPTGLAGQRCFATLFFVWGTSLGKARRQGILDAAPPRDCST